MNTPHDIERFTRAQCSPYNGYDLALAEIRRGCKNSHWIWFIFPQLRGLGRSFSSDYYGIADWDEAARYLAHPVLGARLREICAALLAHKEKAAVDILGGIDAQKVCSCMTLFNELSPNDVFAEVLATFYEGKPCPRTLSMLSESDK